MKKYKVYRITHSSKNKKYIGLTQRDTLEERLQAHFNEMARKAKNSKFLNENSLQFAMFEEYKKHQSNWNDKKFELFRIELIQDFDSEDEMRVQEYKSIVSENTLSPYGYNLMNGSHSIGGRGRNQPIEIKNFKDHNGNTYSWNFSSKKEMYSELSKIYNIEESTIRYRIDKFKKENKWFEEYIDAILYAINFEDKRKKGGTNSKRQKKRRDNQHVKLNVKASFINEIKYPNSNNKFILNSSEFAKQHKISKSTVRARSLRFLECEGFKYIDKEHLNKFIQQKRNEFIKYITTKHSKSQKIIVNYKNKEYSGSLRSLSKEFNINYSSVKKRYKKLHNKLNNEYFKNEDLLYIFELVKKPQEKKGITIPKTFSQRKKLNNYILCKNTSISSQTEFLAVVKEVLDGLGIKYSSLQQKVSKYIPKDEKMSDIEKTDHIIRGLEKQFNIKNLKNEIIDKYNSRKLK